MSQYEPLHELLAQEQRAERFTEPPPYYSFPNIAAWCDFLDVNYPIDVTEDTRRIERMRAAMSARIAALDGLADCAGYARMVLKAWRDALAEGEAL